MRRFINSLSILTGNTIDKIVFVNAEDYDGMTKNEKLYTKFQSIGAEIDIREYKFKTYHCSECKNTNNYKVQAEVDITIAVKLINFSRMPNVETITLVAGDRDFIDSIRYAQENFYKDITIVGFKENMSHVLT